MKPVAERIMSADTISWAVLGSTGFVGSGIFKSLSDAGAKQIREIRAPRLILDPKATIEDVLRSVSRDLRARKAVEELSLELADVDVVINAAGLAAPNSNESPELFGANALLPTVVAMASERAGANRLLHISSAAVQGRKSELDESSYTDPFSPYSASKALGERALDFWSRQRTKGVASAEGVASVVVLRATSVQGPGRGTSAGLARIASSRLSSVAAPGTQPSAVSSLDGLCEFVVTVGMYSGELPPVLLQPWEGATVSDVLALAGKGRAPKLLPVPLAKAGIYAFNAVGRLLPRSRGIARRVEVMWFGQGQVKGWVMEHGLISEDASSQEDDASAATQGRRGPSEHLIRTLGGERVDSRSGYAGNGDGRRKEDR